MYDTPEDMAARVAEYFDGCGPRPVTDKDGVVLMDAKGHPVMRDEPPTMAGLALSLGFKSRQSLWDYRQRGDEFRHVVEWAKTTIEAHHERLLSVKDRCTGSIIWLKNFAEYRDEKTLSGGSPFSVASAAVTLSPDEEEAYRRNFALFFGNGAGHAKPE